MRTVTFLTVVSVAGSIAVASAQESNPLHPIHFWQKGQSATLALSDAGFAATAPSNPLHPGYFAAAALNGVFVGAGDSQGVAYVDDHNPLHPSYGRNAVSTSR
jgi:hypothetical protein